MNTVREKPIKANKYKIAVLRQSLVLLFLIPCSTIPYWYWFDYIPSIWFFMTWEYIYVAIFSTPGVIAGGVIGNFAYDILKKKYGQRISSSKMAQRYFTEVVKAKLR